MLPDDILNAIFEVAGASVVRHDPVGGGCIANAHRVETDDRVFFVKWSRDATVARTFPPEKAGLSALRAAGCPLVIPEPIAVVLPSEGRAGLLVMEWIEQGPRGQDFWETFGSGLADLHRHTAAEFGFDGDNFIGRLPQKNGWSRSWTDFFREHRVEPQVTRAREAGRWASSWNAPLERLYGRLEQILPATPEASILHGDLWSGNFLTHVSGAAALVDPAVYFGHRETDLAMTELFGGFDPRFYEAYRAAWPMEPGYEERRKIYNLYHLINHLNHFGGGYGRSVEAALGG